MPAPLATVLPLLVGFALDLALGDPRRLPHPVVGMGRTIAWLEPRLRRAFPDTPAGRRHAGLVLAVVLPLATLVLSGGLVALAGLASPWLALVLQCLMCYQALATCELRRQTMAVRAPLLASDLPAARTAVSMVVGRETAQLDEAGVTRAAVETVAENASDGVVAPLLFMAIGGGPLALAYKAVNTMDSMVGYKNERYLDFGRAAARLDDVANWLPSRFAALCSVLAASLVSLSAPGAWRVWRRDRRKHASPNAGQTEAAFAGALGLQLNGDATYFGHVVHKPTVGDATRPIEPDDIVRANRLMLATSGVALVACVAVRAGLAGLAVAIVGVIA